MFPACIYESENPNSRENKFTSAWRFIKILQFVRAIQIKVSADPSVPIQLPIFCLNRQTPGVSSRLLACECTVGT